MKLDISKFKAFKETIKINTKNRSLVLFGENGSGKSSIYHALTIIFFHNRLSAEIPNRPTPEEYEIEEYNFWKKYNNSTQDDNFIINIDDISYNDFDNTNYQAFMISIAEYEHDNELELNKLLKRYYFDIEDIERFCINNFSNLQNKVNQTLTNFHETVKITIDEQDDFKIKIKDTERNFERKSNLQYFFNEAKLNIVKLLLLLHTINLSASEEKTKLLVLDDFITSLDSANRTFILKFIFEEFQSFKLIILTHNISFFNLIHYLVNDIYKVSNKFRFANLYSMNNASRLYFLDKRDPIEKIKQELKNIVDEDNSQLEDIGNKIRKKFERLLYELSKLLMIGTVEESNKIIEILENNKTFYRKRINDKKILTTSDLVDEIVEVLELPENQENLLVNTLKDKIDSYRLDDNLDNLKKVINKIKLYRKVTMHPMSHASIHGNMASFEIKEITQSIILLEELETSLKDLLNKNVTDV